MIVLRARLPEQYANAPAEVLFDGILEQLVQQQALAAQVDDLSRTSELVMDNERRALLANEALLDAGRDSVTEEAVQDLYNDTIANVEPLPEFNASHILVETEEEAQAIVEMLEGGADFAETAKEKSTGPSGPNGGQLGWFGLGAMVPEFEKAVTELEDGAISGPGSDPVRLARAETQRQPRQAQAGVGRGAAANTDRRPARSGHRSRSRGCRRGCGCCLDRQVHAGPCRAGRYNASGVIHRGG